MLRYAARALLSKTLQTFLRKYLVDVDVEGVALPSLLDYADGEEGAGAGGGWGVRLSNVRFREGVDLMTLPGVVGRKKGRGRRRVKMQGTKRRRKKGTAQRDTKGCDALGGDRATSGSAPPPIPDVAPDVAREAVIAPGQPAPPSAAAHCPHSLPSAHGAHTEHDQSAQQPPQSQPENSRCAEREIALGRNPSAEEDASSLGYASSAPSTPPTPPQSSSMCSTPVSSGATMFCLRRTSNSNLRTATPTAPNQRKFISQGVASAATRSGPSFPPPLPFTENNRTVLPQQMADESAKTMVADDYGTGVVAAVANTTVQYETFIPRVDHDNTSSFDNEVDFEKLVVSADVSNNSDEENDEHDSDGGESSADDYKTVEDEMALRVGKGGRVGTLDVRLVGKDLHVSVEDAYLVLEALPKKKEGESKDVDKDGKTGGATRDASQTTAAGSGSDKAGGHKGSDGTSASAAKNKSTLPPAGERVMASSSVARMLSSIPFLFLRDCRVRLVIRTGEQEHCETNGAEEKEPPGSIKDGRVRATGGIAIEQVEETTVELGIDFLSVTNGDDFLAHMRTSSPDRDGPPNPPHRAESSPYPSSPRSGLALTKTGGGSFHLEEDKHNLDHENDYMRKRIRTGKGVESGLWFKIHPPHRPRRRQLPELEHHPPGFDGNNVVQDGVDRSPERPVRWALHEWEAATGYNLIRISGLDLHARFFLGERSVKQLIRTPVESNGDEALWGSDFDDYTMDSMLFGVDYIAPVSSTAAVREYNAARDDEYSNEANNQVQHIPIPSNFHRLARGLRPSTSDSCNSGRFHSERTSVCWAGHQSKNHPLDSAMPLAGVLLHVSVVDALEINIDRHSLDVLGLLQNLFSKQELATSHEDADAGAGGDSQGGRALTRTDSQLVAGSGASQLRNGGLPETVNDAMNSRRPNGSSAPAPTNDEKCFPSYMQPESVHMTGLHLAAIVFRFHMMRTDNRKEHGFSFAYWSITLHSFTVEMQKCLASELPFTDVRLDVGWLEVKEWRGVNKSCLLSLGTARESCPSQEKSWTDDDDSAYSDKMWPCASSVLLNVPPPLETLAYESNRSGHAVQLQYVGSPSIPSTAAATATLEQQKDMSSHFEFNLSFVDLGIGHIELDASLSLKSELMTAVEEAKSTLLLGSVGSVKGSADAQLEPAESFSRPEGPTTANNIKKEPPPSQSKLTEWDYNVGLVGGNILLAPIVRCNFPGIHFAGRKTSSAGLLMHTVLNRIEVAYGEQIIPPSDGTSSALSLARLASVPGDVRMRILLFLDDLSPLEKSLGVKKASNPFLRCRAVNKRLGRSKKGASTSSSVKGGGSRKASRQSKKRVAGHHSRLEHDVGDIDRREQMLSQLMKLDDETLGDLLALHEQKETKRRSGTTNSSSRSKKRGSKKKQPLASR